MAELQPNCTTSPPGGTGRARRVWGGLAVAAGLLLIVAWLWPHGTPQQKEMYLSGEIVLSAPAARQSVGADCQGEAELVITTGGTIRTVALTDVRPGEADGCTGEFVAHVPVAKGYVFRLGDLPPLSRSLATIGVTGSTDATGSAGGTVLRIRLDW